MRRAGRRLFTFTAGILLALIAVGVGGILFAVNRASESRSGPVHRFRAPPGEAFLTDDRAAAIGREVMSRDGFPASAWELMSDGRSKAPDGRPDRFLSRNAANPDQGSVHFHRGVRGRRSVS